MRRKKIWIFFLAPPAIVLLIALLGEVAMHLWNWLLPPLFGWHQIGFWQVLGLMLLCRLLFGGFRGGGHGPGPSRARRAMAERWEKMTPEEREKFRQSARSRCGWNEPPAEETSEPA